MLHGTRARITRCADPLPHQEAKNMATIEPYAAKSVYDPPTYAQAVKVTGAQSFLYLAGQVAYGPDGGALHAGDFKAQARAALQALKAQVEAGGGTMANVVKVNTYLTDIRHRADYGAIREEFFGKKLPASTLVAVTALAHPDFLIEIEAVAVL
jgi:enamine deaminase RidA (YjgF/YER057c/UK114 family)